MDESADRSSAGFSTLISRKIFSKTRFALVGTTTNVGPLLAAHEILSFYNNMVAVGGTNSVTGTIWTETLDQGSHPAYLGLTLTFRCQQEGHRLMQRGTLPIFSKGKKVSDLPLEEVWRRVDRP
jgi:hypothetical protein